MRVIHSADWQLGARFRQFGERANELRKARLRTFRRAFEIARERSADAFLIAGDLFEDNGVDDSVVRSVVDVFTEFEDVPVFISPGNHDPYTGPGSVWERPAFKKSPPGVRVFRQAECVEFRGSFVIASPLHQKKSTLDPSLKLAELARDLGDAPRIGLTHGSPDIPGSREDNDFPIALNAATRAGLDFLGLGHWHSWLEFDDARMLMPGTPEPDGFDRRDCGSVALVEISSRGDAPRIEKLPVATICWHSFDFNFLDVATARELLQAEVEKLKGRALSTVVRVNLKGTAAREILVPARAWVNELLAQFPISQLHDESGLALTAAELEFVKNKHPILAQVLADLDQLAAMKLNQRNDTFSAEPLSVADADQILAGARIDPAQLTAAHFELARQLLLQNLREAQ